MGETLHVFINAVCISLGPDVMCECECLSVDVCWSRIHTTYCIYATSDAIAAPITIVNGCHHITIDE